MGDIKQRLKTVVKARAVIPKELQLRNCIRGTKVNYFSDYHCDIYRVLRTSHLVAIWVGRVTVLKPLASRTNGGVVVCAGLQL